MMTFLRRCVTAVRRSRLEEDLRDEIARHIEQRRQQLVADGMDPRAALDEARRMFGNVTAIREESRDMWGFRALDTIGQDVRYALRLMRRAPLFTMVGVLSIAIGVAASTLVASIVNAAMWRWSAMYRDPDRLTYVYQTREAELWTPTPADYRDWRDMTKSFGSVHAYTYTPMNLTGDGAPQRLVAAAVSPGLFTTLGVNPVIGTGFAATDDVWGRHRRVLLSDGAWRRHFGGDPSVLGRRLTLNGEPYEIAGVMPPGAWFSASRPDIFVPLSFAPDDPANNRNSHFIWVIARLADGVTLDAANAELDVIARQIAAIHPANKGMGARAVLMADNILERPAATLTMIGGAVTLVLLLACANVAGLLLVRTAARERELAIRVSLGAGRMRVARQLLTESLALALLGGALGVACAVLAAPYIATVLPADLPRLHEIGVPLDWTVLTIAAVATVGSGVLIGLAPAFNLARRETAHVMKDSGRGTTTGRGQLRVRSVLVAAEVGLALVLTLGAGLLLRSVDGLHKASLGVRTSDLLIVRVPLSAGQSRGQDAATTTAYLERIVERARSVPGVIAADMTSHVPLGGGGQAKSFRVIGRPVPAALEDIPRVSARQEGPDSLRAMGATLLRGRFFTEQDRASGVPVAIVGQSLARRFFAGEDPVGKVISFEPPENVAPPGYREAAGGPFVNWTIVGVIDDIRYLHPSQPVESVVYVPYRQRTRRALMGWAPEYLVLHTRLTAAEIMPVLRERVNEVAAAQPLADARSIETMVREAFGGTYLSTTVLAVFSLVALLLAAIGVYGSVASAVAARTQEIGVRVALGAQPGSVIWLVLRQMTLLAAAGIGVGLVAASLSGRLFASQLYGVTARDAVTLLAAPLVVAAAALLAAWLPARRAAAIDPVVALRDY